MSLAIALAVAAAAAPAVQSTRLSAEQVKLGAPFTDEVVIKGGAGQGFQAQALPAGSPFTLLGQDVEDGAADAVVKLQFGLYALGPHALPDVTLVSRAGQRLVVPGEAKITGSSSLAKADAQLHPLAGPRVPLVLAPARVALAGLALLLGLGLLGLAARGIVRRVRRGASPQQRDRRALEALLRSGCGDLEFYLALDGIVRRHLEARHGIPALERTAAELAALIPSALPQAELGLLFGEANLVKFAARPARPAQRDADGRLAARLLAEPGQGSHHAALS